MKPKVVTHIAAVFKNGADVRGVAVGEVDGAFDSSGLPLRTVAGGIQESTRDCIPLTQGATKDIHITLSLIDCGRYLAL